MSATKTDLDPLYQMALTLNNDGSIKIESQKIKNFSVVSFSSYGEYTLVQWRYKVDESEYFTGENLWQGKEPLLTSGGQLDLTVAFDGANPDTLRTGHQAQRALTALTHIIGNTENANIPLKVAQELRDPKRKTFFKLS